MDALTIAAASGLRSRAESLDMLANNIANASSAGFKADREFYNLYTSAEASAGDDGSAPANQLPVIERHWTDFSQGTLTTTGNPLDLALTGGGFFLVQTPNGTLYTRDGNFRLSPDGKLQTQDGYAVLSSERKPIVLDPSQEIDISSDGTIQQGGEQVAVLGIASFQDLNALEKQGSNYYRFRLSSLPPQLAAPDVHQGALESANAQPAEAAVRLVAVMRQFEMLQKAMNIGGDMCRRSIEEVAKVV
jgi:flagellar basal-body rod protein FlgF